MRKCRDGEKKWEKREKKKRMIKIVATTSLPAFDRPNADRWNTARSCQLTLFVGDPLHLAIDLNLMRGLNFEGLITHDIQKGFPNL